MKASVLFSGGKDSSLSAILLEPFFDVELVTCNFGLLPTGDIAFETASQLGFPHRVLQMDRKILETALELIVKDGYPKNAINYLHEKAVEILASEAGTEFIADGIRRDDRVPVIEIPKARSIEDRFGVQYICPLKGYSRGAVNLLVEKYLVIEEGESDRMVKADYETELRELLRQRFGNEQVLKLFPENHIQSHVLSRKQNKKNRL